MSSRDWNLEGENEEHCRVKERECQALGTSVTKTQEGTETTVPGIQALGTSVTKTQEGADAIVSGSQPQARTSSEGFPARE